MFSRTLLKINKNKSVSLDTKTAFTSKMHRSTAASEIVYFPAIYSKSKSSAWQEYYVERIKEKEKSTQMTYYFRRRNPCWSITQWKHGECSTSGLYSYYIEHTFFLVVAKLVLTQNKYLQREHVISYAVCVSYLCVLVKEVSLSLLCGWRLSTAWAVNPQLNGDKTKKIETVE